MTRSHDRVFFLMAFAVLLSSVVLTLVFGAYAGDPEYFSYVGRCLLAGRHMYVDIWDCKGPILYFVSALGVLIHPIFGQTLLFAAIFAADLVLFHGLVRRVGGTRAGLSALLFAVLALGARQYVSIGRQEMLVCLLVLSGLWFQGRAAPWGDLFTGCCAGLAFFVKPNLITFLSVPLVQGMLAANRTGEWRRFVIRCICLAAGFASVLLTMTACFLPDAVGELWTGSLLWNLLQRSQNASGWFDFWSHAFFRHRFWVRHGWIIPVFWSLLAIGLSRVIVAREKGWACWAVWAILETAAAFAFPGFCAHYVIVACLPVALLAVGKGLGASVRQERGVILLVTALVLPVLVIGGIFLHRHIGSVALRGHEIHEMSERIGAGSGHVTVCGCNKSIAVMNKLGLLSGQRFPGMMFWWKLSSKDFREEIVEDFLRSLDTEGEWLICEKRIEGLPHELKSGRIAEALSGYSLEYRAVGNKVYLYRRSR